MAIWARPICAHFPLLSTALNRTIQNLAARGQTIDDYNYENKEIGEIILEEIGDTKFDGISVSAQSSLDTYYITVIATFLSFPRTETNFISEPKTPDRLARRRVGRRVSLPLQCLIRRSIQEQDLYRLIHAEGRFN